MRTKFVLGKLVLLATVVFAIEVAHAGSDSPPRSELRSAFLGPDGWDSVPLTSGEISNQLKTHFGEVLKILDDQRDVSLNEAVTLLGEQYGPFDQAKADWVKRTLAKRRAWQVRTLFEYAQRGQFPQNENHAANAVPIFVDNHQTHCAVGYLMHRSGHAAAVTEVVETNNFVYVKDATEGGLVDWIMFSGLTQDEAALIQPGYQPPSTDATLNDFADVNFSYTENGLTISELNVLEYSFDANSSQDFNAIYAQGIFGVNTVGTAKSNGFGVAVGSGPYNADCYMCDYTPGLNNWMFLSGSLGTPSGSTASMYRIDYRVRATEGLFFNQISLGASPNFSQSVVDDPDGYLRVVTEAYDENGSFLDEGMIAADNQTFFLSGVAFLETDNKNELLVTNYVLNYGDNSTGGFGGYQSHWQGFGLTAIPEPATSAIFLLIVCGVVSRRRR